MNVQTFPIDGLLLFENKVFADERGFFTERYRADNPELNFLNREFVQENFSLSRPGVLRGLHYQYDQPQGKLVTCMRGRIFDVAVDIRQGSPTFGQHVRLILDAEKPSWFWIPPGFAHGFCVLGDAPADVYYKVDSYWNGKGESGILWNDPELQIEWPIQNPTLSDKDLTLQTFADYKQAPAFREAAASNWQLPNFVHN